MLSVPVTHRAKKLSIHIGVGARERVRAMLDRQDLNGLPASQRELPSGAIGCLGGSTIPTQGNVCFFAGLPINGPDVGRLIDADAAARLFPEYDGAFVGVFWDEQRETLVVVNDFLGMQPLYLRDVDGELTLVSETKAIEGDPDLAAWGAVLSLGRPIGERSLVNGLKRVPPASIVTYDCARRRLEIRRYWDWPEPSDAWRDYDFLDALERDMHAYVAFGEPGTVLLSGGFDSRMLVFLLRRAAIPAGALIVSHEDELDDTDGRFAERVAGLAGLPYRKVRPRRDFFSSTDYLDYLRASDAGFPSMDLFIAKVAAQIECAAVWDGLTGSVFHAEYQPEGGFAEFLPDRVQGPDSLAWRAARIVFKPAVVEAMREGFEADLRAEVAGLPPDVFGVTRFVIEDRIRNRPAMNPLKVYANRTNVFTPGLSKNFIAHAVVIPPEAKRRDRFYRDLFARLDKRALTVPFLSGGKLMANKGTSPAYWREWLRIEFDKHRSRHPRWFPVVRRPQSEISAFIGKHLLVDGDRWLDPQLPAKLTEVTAANYAAWKLLFHWKAWQWVHDGRLGSMLGDKVRPAPQTANGGRGH